MSTSKYSGEILLSTLWSQDSDGDLVFNTYCPIDTVTGDRSIVGCAALMHAQILYYWAEQGADLSLTLTSADAYQTSTRRIYISGEASATYDYGVFSDINEQLAEISADTTDDIAALCYACGVLISADYTSTATSASMTDDVYVRAGFDSFNLVSSTSNTLFFTTVSSRFSSTTTITDAGWEVIQDNLLNGLVIAVASSALGHALIMDGYNEEDETYHLNFGWGSNDEKQYSSSYGCYIGTGWYTASEVNALSIYSLGIDLYPDYDGTVFTVTDSREYGVGTLYRVIEQAGGIQGEVTIDFSADLAEESISLTTALPSVSHDLTIKNMYGDIRIQTASSGMPGSSGTAEASLSSDTTLEIENFAANFAAINASSSAIAVEGGTSLVIDSLNGVVAANTLSTSYALYSGETSDITLVNGGLFAGKYTVSASSGESAITNIFTAFGNFVTEGVSALSTIASCATGYAVYSGNGDDTLTLTDHSAVLGCVYLAGGKNSITVESGSHLYSYITATADTLLLNLVLKECNSTPLISLVDLTVKSFWNSTVYYGIDALVSALADAISVDVSQAESGSYTLLSGVSEDACSDVVFDLGDDIQLSIGGTTEYGKYTLSFDDEDLILTVAAQEKHSTPITITANSASKMYDATALTDAGYTYTQDVLADGDELVVTVEGSITNAGTAANRVTGYKVMRGTKDVTAYYTFADTVDGTLTVTKRDVTLTSASDSKVYDETALTNGTVTVSGSGFAAGEGYAATVTGAQTNVGSSANTFTYTLNDGTEESNYIITTVEGELTVTQAENPIIKGVEKDGTTTVVRWTPTSESESVDIALTNANSQDETLVVRTDDKAIELYSLSADCEVALKDAEDSVWGESTQISGTPTESATAIVSNENDIADLFFASAVGTWNAGYVAQNAGSVNDWSGTREIVEVEGKNQIADTFSGSTDANILFLTDDANGDALFVEDFFTAFPEEQQARITQIHEIRAGAGDDVVDMTSQICEYTGDGVTVRGGAGNDTIWANKGNNTLFGDAGNDRLVGASGNDVLAGGAGNDSMHGGGGNDIFTFCENWGTDTVEQLSGGSVTLWFASGSRSNWDSDTMTYTDGKNSVKVTGTSTVTLKFGDDGSEQYATLVSAGCFMEETSDKIFDGEQKGILATV